MSEEEIDIQMGKFATIAHHFSRAHIGIHKVLGPMRTELATAQSIIRFMRHRNLRPVLRQEIAQLEHELQEHENKSLWRDYVCDCSLNLNKK